MKKDKFGTEEVIEIPRVVQRTIKEKVKAKFIGRIGNLLEDRVCKRYFMLSEKLDIFEKFGFQLLMLDKEGHLIKTYFELDFDKLPDNIKDRLIEEWKLEKDKE